MLRTDITQSYLRFRLSSALAMSSLVDRSCSTTLIRLSEIHDSASLVQLFAQKNLN